MTPVLLQSLACLLGVADLEGVGLLLAHTHQWAAQSALNEATQVSYHSGQKETGSVFSITLKNIRVLSRIGVLAHAMRVVAKAGACHKSRSHSWEPSSPSKGMLTTSEATSAPPQTMVSSAGSSGSNAAAWQVTVAYPVPTGSPMGLPTFFLFSVSFSFAGMFCAHLL